MCHERAVVYQACGASLKMGVGLSKSALQKQASNHLKLRRSRAFVVSVEAKGGARLWQVRFKETNESKPLMTCRNPSDGVETGVDGQLRDKSWETSAYRPTGVRHVGGVTLSQALMRKVGTCRPRCEGRNPSGQPPQGESTDAGHRGGVARSRVEGSVMGLDRRGGVVRLYSVGNPQGEDPRG